MLEWRRDNELDTLLEKPDPHEAVYQTVCPHGHHKLDKQGHPVYVERTGQVKMPELLKHVAEVDTVSRHLRWLEYMTRRLHHASADCGRNIYTQTIIFDLSGFTMRPDSAGLRVFKETMRIDQEYYPERLHKFFMINAPWYFRFTWAIAQLFLDPVTRNKVEILGSDYKGRLLEHIDAHSLPAEFGGKCQCPSPIGCVQRLPRPFPVKEPDKAYVGPWPDLTRYPVHAASSGSSTAATKASAAVSSSSTPAVTASAPLQTAPYVSSATTSSPAQTQKTAISAATTSSSTSTAGSSS